MKMIFVLLFSALICLGAAEPPAKTQWMDIILERQQASIWTAVDPGLVLTQGDVIRFRFRSNFDGYLYVTNRGSSGTEMLLFPREETGQANRIQAGKDYLVPATQTHFRVSGPAGYDSIYWLVSPVSLSVGPSLPKLPESNMPPPRQPDIVQPGNVQPGNVQPERAATLTPRCDPSQLRARGFCIDTEAGVRNVENPAKAPAKIAQTPDLQPRDLTMIQSKNRTRISTGGALGGPVVYEFRLAHK